MHPFIETQKEWLKDVPPFRAGDTLRVNVRVREGDKERLQAFEGVCIARRGSGVSASFTVRKISNGVGVERIFPVHSPMIAEIVVVRRGRVRRAKLFYLRTLAGKAMLAVAHNRLAARLMGISVRRVLAVSFALSAALGALAGLLIAPIAFTAWDSGVMLGLKGFAAAILGGTGSLPGAVLGGLIVGIAENVSLLWINPGYKQAMPFLVLLVVLLVRPEGLFSERK